MPRRARIVAADTPFHVIQRGIDRGACFFSEDDFRFYLDALATAASSENVAVHAYVLMTNTFTCSSPARRPMASRT